jgi:hypothetical protein
VSFIQFAETIPVVAQSKEWVYCLSLAGIERFESRRGPGCQSLLGVLCYQAEVSATSCSLVQRSPTAVVYLSVIVEPHRGGLCPLGQSSHEKRAMEFGHTLGISPSQDVYPSHDDVHIKIPPSRILTLLSKCLSLLRRHAS